MTETKLTLGKAIDQIVEALQHFDNRDRVAILNTVCAHLQIEGDRQAQSAQPEVRTLRDAESHASKVSQKPEDGLDIRTLRTQKAPTSARQMACLVAYYLQEHAPDGERKDTITTADLEKYFKQAGYKLPEKLEQLLIDSKKSGYFDSSKRGEYKLTRVGYNLVTHNMPSKEKA